MKQALVCAIAALLPSAAMSQEQVMVAVPDGFAVAHDAEDDSGSLREFIHADDSLEAWDAMLTLRVFDGQNQVPPEELHRRLMGFVEEACPGAGGQMVSAGEAHGYAFHVIIMGCPMSPITGGEEWFLSKAVTGQDNLYLVQGAWRGPVTEAQVLFWSDVLDTVALCDPSRFDLPCDADRLP